MIVPKIGAMKNIRLSVHSKEHTKLRQLLIRRRLDLGLSQRALAERMDVVHSFVGKVETGDRRMDIFEFIEYCRALDWDASEVVRGFRRARYDGFTGLVEICRTIPRVAYQFYLCAKSVTAQIYFAVQPETFAKKPFPRQPKPKQRFSAVFVSNIH